MKVLLTGSSKGIGYKIAQDLLTEGHKLALHYNKNKSPLDALLKDCLLYTSPSPRDLG